MGLGCVICGSRSVDRCHIRSRGAGGPDADFNLLNMCRRHHTEQHAIGWYKMARKYPSLYFHLEQKGWVFLGFRIWNNKLREPSSSQ